MYEASRKAAQRIVSVLNEVGLSSRPSILNPITEIINQEFSINKEMIMEPMMTRKEVAEYLHITVDTVGNMMRRGEIPYSKAGRRVLIAERDVKKLIDSNKKEGA